MEATFLCVDNSDHTRNGDYRPSRWESEQDAVQIMAGLKTQRPENVLGMLTMAGKSPEVHVTLTKDVGLILTALHRIDVGGTVDLLGSLQTAHLALRHRPDRSARQRIVAFVGSPVHATEKELVKVAKKLRKFDVAVDVILFGQEEKEDPNEPKLRKFIETVNQKENSHLVFIPPGSGDLGAMMLETPALFGGDGGGGQDGGEGQPGGQPGGGGFEFGVNPATDPEMYEALRLSRLEYEESQRRQAEEQAKEKKEGEQEGDMLEEEEDGEPTYGATAMELDEDAQMALALKLSMEQEGEPKAEEKEEEEEDVSRMVQDAGFMQSLLSDLPGVDPGSARIQSALADLGGKREDGKDEESEGKKKKRKDDEKKKE